MRRTGDRALIWGLVLLFPLVAGAETEFSQQADRAELGVQDTFTVTVTVADAPEGAELVFPESADFEVMSRMQSSQRSFQLMGGRSGIRHVETYTLVMRPLRTGKLTLPPAQLKTPQGTLKTQPVTVVVKPGSTAPGRTGGAARSRLPPGMQGLPGFDEALEELFALPEERIPRSDSDLFLRAYLDKNGAFVGEQVTYSLYIFARVDLSSVDAVTLPKMDGFWAEDVDSPTQLSGEPRTLDGIPYRAYLLKRRALFPEKAGKVEIPAATAEITTGFLFSGRRLRRESNKLSLEVKPPPPGASPDFRPEQVGEWKLSVEAQPLEVDLGQPLTVRVVLEGKGNLKRQVLPKLPSIAGIKAYDPTHTDTLTTRGGRVGGRRVQEYLVMPQRTGTFALPALRFSFFNPRVGRYQTSETAPLQLSVKPGPGAPPETAGGGPITAPPAQKNVLTSGTLRPLRAEADLRSAGAAPWRRPLFFGLGFVPVGAFLAAALATRTRVRRAEDAATVQRRKARAARERLGRARSLLQGPADAFYAELERAVLSSLELKVGAPVGGLARPDLLTRLGQAGFTEKQRGQVVALLEACESARYAPGLDPGAGPVREAWLEQARALIGGGEA